MMFKKFMVYIENGEDVLKVAVPAKNEKDVRAYCEGNGDIIAIKEVTKEYTINQIDIVSTLLDAGFDKYTVDFINRALYRTGIIND